MPSALEKVVLQVGANCNFETTKVSRVAQCRQTPRHKGANCNWSKTANLKKDGNNMYLGNNNMIRVRQLILQPLSGTCMHNYKYQESRIVDDDV